MTILPSRKHVRTTAVVVSLWFGEKQFKITKKLHKNSVLANDF